MGFALLSLAACGSTSVLAPNGPYFSPSPAPEVQVILRSCKEVDGLAKGDITYMKTQVVRQGTLLQRVGDDLTGAVPGGNVANDTRLVEEQSKGMSDRIGTSTLCEKVRTPLAQKAKALVDADTALRSAGAGAGDVAGALERATVAYLDLDKAIKALG